MIARFALLLTGALALAACQQQEPVSNEVTNDIALPPVVDQVGATPMGERVAVIGLLNKRNGIVRDLTLRPGQSVRVKDVIIRLRACETTAPWETERLTGAFLQVDVQRPDKQFARVFSGWVYKESPSLNVVEHPVYDVWPKSCAMNWPAAAEEAGPLAGGNTSSNAVQSGRGGSSAERSASPSNPT